MLSDQHRGEEPQQLPVCWGDPPAQALHHHVYVLLFPRHTVVARSPHSAVSYPGGGRGGVLRHRRCRHCFDNGCAFLKTWIIIIFVLIQRGWKTHFGWMHSVVQLTRYLIFFTNLISQHATVCYPLSHVMTFYLRVLWLLYELLSKCCGNTLTVSGSRKEHLLND